MKSKLTSTPILAIPNFDRLFEVETNASKLETGASLMQEGRLAKYFSDKLCEARQNWTTDEQELFVVFQAFQQWEHYLRDKSFVLRSDHKTL